jgi:hypothetical protein
MFAQRIPPTANRQSQPGKCLGAANFRAPVHGSTQLDATKVLQNEYYTWLTRPPRQA